MREPRRMLFSFNYGIVGSLCFRCGVTVTHASANSLTGEADYRSPKVSEATFYLLLYCSSAHAGRFALAYSSITARLILPVQQGSFHAPFITLRLVRRHFFLVCVASAPIRQTTY